MDVPGLRWLYLCLIIVIGVLNTPITVTKTIAIQMGIESGGIVQKEGDRAAAFRTSKTRIV